MPPTILIKSRIRIRQYDPAETFGFTKEKARMETQLLCEKIGALQAKLYANNHCSVLVIFQGMDASGKDGATNSLLKQVNPAGVEVSNFKAPSSEELAHDFLWRVHKAIPRFGRIGVFNRSHYEDVLVARVLNLVPKSTWSLRYQQINRFELNLHEAGCTLLKLYLHISPQEQAERLRARLEDPAKNWKFESSDLQMRERWEEFMDAYQDILNRCSPAHARWHLIPADRKWVRDYVIAQRVCEALEELNLTWPKPKEDLSLYTIKDLPNHLIKPTK